MWNKPWNMKEGFLIGGGLIFAGLALQLSVGPVVWDAFAWPVNGIVLAGFMVMLTAMVYLRKKVYAFQWMTTNTAAIPAMVWAVVLTIIMGLTRQQVNGTWLNNMLSFWPFVLIYVYIAVILGLTIHRRLRQIFKGQGSIKRDVPFFLNHLGLFLALTTATLGCADMQRVKMITAIGEPEWRAMEQSETTIDVNKPCEVDGWKIYQYGYDTQRGAQSQISILELVSDPWLPWVYAGIYMMLAGAVLMTLEVLWRRLRKATKKQLGWYLYFAVLASLFAYFFFDSYNTKTLVPALQSPWFAPHVFVYIFAYTLLGIAVVIAWWKSADDLVYVSLAFLTIGMLFGALWAKEAWGHYWSWDPKETWAAITWLSYLVYVHYRHTSLRNSLPSNKEGGRSRLAFWILIVSFILLQMCWWGINYLPSAQGSSVHTYSTSK